MSSIEKAPGVYVIRNLTTGKVYVGSSVNMYKRWFYGHIYQLKAGKHGNRYLQAAWLSHGPKQFVFEVIEVCAVGDDLIAREQFHIDRLKSYLPEVGYNLRRVANSNLGMVTSAATKIKLSIAGKGKPKHAGHGSKVSAGKRGHSVSEETRRLISEKLTGRVLGPYSPDRVRKAADALVGKKFSDERKAGLREAAKGRKMPPKTDEHKAKIREALRVAWVLRRARLSGIGDVNG